MGLIAKLSETAKTWADNSRARRHEVVDHQDELRARVGEKPSKDSQLAESGCRPEETEEVEGPCRAVGQKCDVRGQPVQICWIEWAEQRAVEVVLHRRGESATLVFDE